MTILVVSSTKMGYQNAVLGTVDYLTSRADLHVKLLDDLSQEPDVILHGGDVPEDTHRFLDCVAQFPNARSYQFGNPQCASEAFTRIYDWMNALEGANVSKLPLAPHAVTPVKLAAEKTKWDGRLPTDKPIFWLAVGGDISVSPMRREHALSIVEQIGSFPALEEMNLCLTTSHRTSEETAFILENGLGERLALYHNFRKEGDVSSPYWGLMSYADLICITADSASMAAEAAVTGKPVYTLDPGHLDDKHLRVVMDLSVQGISRSLQDFSAGERLQNGRKTVGNTAEQVAQEIVTDYYQKLSLM